MEQNSTNISKKTLQSKTKSGKIVEAEGKQNTAKRTKWPIQRLESVPKKINKMVHLGHLEKAEEIAKHFFENGRNELQGSWNWVQLKGNEKFNVKRKTRMPIMEEIVTKNWTRKKEIISTLQSGILTTRMDNTIMKRRKQSFPTVKIALDWTKTKNFIFNRKNQRPNMQLMISHKLRKIAFGEKNENQIAQFKLQTTCFWRKKLAGQTTEHFSRKNWLHIGD